MKYTRPLKSLISGLLISSAFLFGVVQAQSSSWIPIKSGSELIFIPYYDFRATKQTPSQYQLTWNDLNHSSYLIERLTIDDTQPFTVEGPATQWQHVARVTGTSLLQAYDIRSFDLNGHQTYRLSGCEADYCDEVDEISFFIRSDEMSNTTPQNFRVSQVTTVNHRTASVSASANRLSTQLADDDTDNPFAPGLGYSMLSGHDAPSRAPSIKATSFRMAQSNATTVSVVGNRVQLEWDEVDNATHYVIARTVIKADSPTKTFLNNSAYTEWAAQTSYTYELVGGEYQFKVYACFDSKFNVDREETVTFSGYCGTSSTPLAHDVPIPIDTLHQPQQVTLSGGAHVDGNESYALSWKAPVNIDTATLKLTGYKVYGELKGLLTSEPIPHTSASETLSLTRNTAALRLVPGRQYCYKIVPQYQSKANGSTINGQPGYPAPDQCVAVGGPVLAAPENFSIVEQSELSHYYRKDYLFTWQPVDGADYYQIDREIDYGQGIWSPVYAGTTTISIQILTENRNEAYRISACTYDGRCGDYNRLYFWARGNIDREQRNHYQTPSCQMMPKISALGSQIPVTWCAPHEPGVTHYELVGFRSNPIYKAEVSSFNRTNQGLFVHFVDARAPGSSYCLSVTAYYGSDSYNRYPPACTRMALETPASFELTVTNALTGSYRLNWPLSSGATRYLLQSAPCHSDCATLNEADWSSENLGASETEKHVNGQTNGLYAHRIAACQSDDPDSCSDFSAPVTITIGHKPVVFIHTDTLGTPMVESDEQGKIK